MSCCERTVHRRLLRRLAAGWQAGWRVDFSSREDAIRIFEEGRGPLLTDGIHACMDSSHLSYGVTLSEDSGETGLRIAMDDRGVSCGGAHIAVGHLASYQYLSYGDFTWRARIHHAPDGGPPPPNSFTCFSTFRHNSGEAWNELAWCFPAKDGTEVHMSYWVDDHMHRAVVRLDVDLTRNVHTFTTRWRPAGVDWLVDGAVVHQLRGRARLEVPWEPMSVRVILRPVNRPSVYLGDARVAVSRVEFEPAYTRAGDDEQDGLVGLESHHSPPPAPSPSPPPPPRPPGWHCRADICADVAGDCCAPGTEDRACSMAGYEVVAGGVSSFDGCVKQFGADAVFTCCGEGVPPRGSPPLLPAPPPPSRQPSPPPLPTPSPPPSLHSPPPPPSPSLSSLPLPPPIPATSPAARVEALVELPNASPPTPSPPPPIAMSPPTSAYVFAPPFTSAAILRVAEDRASAVMIANLTLPWLLLAGTVLVVRALCRSRRHEPKRSTRREHLPRWAGRRALPADFDAAAMAQQPQPQPLDLRFTRKAHNGTSGRRANGAEGGRSREAGTRAAACSSQHSRKPRRGVHGSRAAASLELRAALEGGAPRLQSMLSRLGGRQRGWEPLPNAPGARRR